MLNASSKRMILQDVCWGCSGSKQPCLVFHLLPSCAVPKDPRSLLFLAGACAWFFVFFFSPPFLFGEQPDQNGCDPKPRIAPFAMEMRSGGCSPCVRGGLLLTGTSWSLGERGQRGGARIIPLGTSWVFGVTLTLCVFKRYL